MRLHFCVCGFNKVWKLKPTQNHLNVLEIENTCISSATFFDQASSAEDRSEGKLPPKQDVDHKGY